MDKQEEIKIIESLQETVGQMKIDDLEESSELAFEFFSCNCCGKEKIVAGSVIYKDYRLCNECVLVAETAFALNKIQEIEDLIDLYEDNRFDNTYNSLFGQDNNSNN